MLSDKDKDREYITAFLSEYDPVDIDVASNIKSLRQGPLFDVTLETPGGEKYSAHKCILSLSSEYFKALFSGRFAKTDTVILTDVDPDIVNLYLDVIYGKQIEPLKIGWKATLKLLIFCKFTQTTIPQRDVIVVNVPVPPKDFVKYIQQLSILYDEEIPINIVKSLKMDLYTIDSNGKDKYITDINFSEFSEEFVIALIETCDYESVKYLIAQRAVSEGMSVDLYNLIRLDKLLDNFMIKDMITPESMPYLRQLRTPVSSVFDINAGNELILKLKSYKKYIFTSSDLFIGWTAETNDNYIMLLIISVPLVRDQNKKNVAKLARNINARFRESFGIKIKDFVIEGDLFDRISQLWSLDDLSDINDIIVVRDYELLD